MDKLIKNIMLKLLDLKEHVNIKIIINTIICKWKSAHHKRQVSMMIKTDYTTNK